MRNRKVQFIILLFLWACLLSNGQNNKSVHSSKNILLAGTAKILITPVTPIHVSGYDGRNDPFKGVHNDLFARVIVFSDGVNKAVLITTDLGVNGSQDKYVPTGGYEVSSTSVKTGAEKAIINDLIEMINEL